MHRPLDPTPAGRFAGLVDPGRPAAPARRSLLLATAAAAFVPAARSQPAPEPPAVPPSATPDAPPLAGTVQSKSIEAREIGRRYPVRLYAPPGVAPTTPLPIVYLIDAEWRLETLARVAESKRVAVRLAGIANEETRNHDDLPSGACNPEGGGQAAFLDFLVAEFRPFVESRVAVDPARRALWGHSYGGAFVLDALFAEPGRPRAFSAYLVADPSIRCLGPIAPSWEADFAKSNERLPVRLHYAWANPANAPFAERIRERGYRDLRLVSKGYPGGHDGMIPAAFADALDLAFGTS